MSAFSDYLEDQITGWIAGTTFAGAPSETFVQLFNGDPTDGSTGGTAIFEVTKETTYATPLTGI